MLPSSRLEFQERSIRSRFNTFLAWVARGLLGDFGLADLPQFRSLCLRKVPGLVRPVFFKETSVVTDRLTCPRRLPDMVADVLACCR